MTTNANIYPPIEEWLVPETVCAATLAGVRPSGRLGRESGVFWLGTRSSQTAIEAVVLPSGAGVEEHPYQWHVSPEVFGEISRWAKPRGLTLIAVVHIHLEGVPIDLSWADRTQSVQVPGMLAIVIGNAGLDDVHTDWAWFVYETNDYRRISDYELSKRLILTNRSKVDVYRADLFGVVPADLH